MELIFFIIILQKTFSGVVNTFYKKLYKNNRGSSYFWMFCPLTSLKHPFEEFTFATLVFNTPHPYTATNKNRKIIKYDKNCKMCCPQHIHNLINIYNNRIWRRADCLRKCTKINNLQKIPKLQNMNYAINIYYKINFDSLIFFEIFQYFSKKSKVFWHFRSILYNKSLF